jgi:hypothetical protein
MSTCRDGIKAALRALKVTAPGEDPHIDQLTSGLRACQDVLTELHEARVPLREIDVPGNNPPPGFNGQWIANQDTRIRIGAGSSVTVILPNAVPMFPGEHPYDYGFVGAPWWNVQGSTGQADGVCWRAPTDGARIEVVGAATDLWFYRADLNQWLPVYDIRLDDELPLNVRYRGPFASLVAERCVDELSVEEPTPWLARRIAAARATMFIRPGRHAEPTRTEYF